MSFSISFDRPKIPFRSKQCKKCKNYKNDSCEAYVEKVSLPFGTSTTTMWPIFSGETQESCPKYSKN